MIRQLVSRSHAESRPLTSNNFSRQGVLLTAVSLLLIVAPVVESQEQPAKQRPGRVKLIDNVTGNREFIVLLAFTNGGKTLVSLSNDYGDKPRGLEIKSWDVATRKVTATISQTEPAYGCALSPDGNTLAVGLQAPRGQPTAIRLFDLRNEKKPRDIKVDDSAFMRAVAISSDGKTLAWVVSPEQVGSGLSLQTP